MGDTIWNPLGDGIAFLEVKNGTVYRSKDGHLTFAPDPEAVAKAIGSEVERVMKLASNGCLVDPKLLAARSRAIVSEAKAEGVDLSALAGSLGQ